MNNLMMRTYNGIYSKFSSQFLNICHDKNHPDLSILWTILWWGDWQWKNALPIHCTMWLLHTVLGEGESHLFKISKISSYSNQKSCLFFRIFNVWQTWSRRCRCRGCTSCRSTWPALLNKYKKINKYKNNLTCLGGATFLGSMGSRVLDVFSFSFSFTVTWKIQISNLLLLLLLQSHRDRGHAPPIASFQGGRPWSSLDRLLLPENYDDLKDMKNIYVVCRKPTCVRTTALVTLATKAPSPSTLATAVQALYSSWGMMSTDSSSRVTRFFLPRLYSGT